MPADVRHKSQISPGVAGARHLGAEICLATEDDNTLLRAAADRRDIPIRSIG